jgi:hypothetical protein
MEKEFVTYEQSLALNELGFNEECCGYYADNILYIYEIENKNLCDGAIVCPLKQQVFRWFREKYDLHHIVIWDSDTNNFDAGLFGELVVPFVPFLKDAIFPTYEEAENACIDKLIETAKESKS